MSILALDTSMGACSAAVLERAVPGGKARIMAARCEIMARGHAEALMPMIRAVMGEAGLAFSAIDRIAVTCGPGTFTGLRVAIAAARGLALAAGLPVVAETSLRIIGARALARTDTASGPAPRSLLVVTDARRGGLYVQALDADARPLAAPALLDRAGALARLAELPAPVLLAGSGARLVAEAWRGNANALAGVLADIEPDAATLARLAVDLQPGARPPSPLYLRPPDARPQPAMAVARREE